MSLIENKKVRLNYEILEQFEAGIELFGFEVKSLRGHHGSLDGAYVTIRGAEAYSVGIHIPPYQVANTPESYDPLRIRRLLLHKKEITKLSGVEGQKGLTIVPLSVYNKGTNIKVSIAIVKGKKKHDKRESLKKREAMRDINRTLKGE